MSSFALNPRLEGDSLFVADLPLSMLRLMRNSTYPWLMLIPRKSGLVELIDLEEADQMQLMREIALTSTVLRSVTDCEKLNVAALGNQVPQLHIHVIARFRGDLAWPAPVWGVVPAVDYDPERANNLTQDLRNALSDAAQ